MDNAYSSIGDRGKACGGPGAGCAPCPSGPTTAGRRRCGPRPFASARSRGWARRSRGRSPGCRLSPSSSVCVALLRRGVREPAVQPVRRALGRAVEHARRALHEAPREAGLLGGVELHFSTDSRLRASLTRASGSVNRCSRHKVRQYTTDRCALRGEPVPANATAMLDVQLKYLSACLGAANRVALAAKTH